MNSLDTIGVAGLILKATIEDFDHVKKLILQECPQVTIVYQRMSPGPLRIINGVET